MIVSLLTIGLLLLPSTNAFWRLPCAKPVINGRIDPIVAPGKASSHSHTIMGSSAIGYSTTFDDLTSSNCTTCKVNDDKSAYWIPELYYQYPNGSFVVVDHGGLIVYYLQRSGSNETVQPFPDGLRMLTGNPYARNDTGTDASRAISWLCIDFNGPAQPQTPGFTNTNCPNGLRGQVFFPSCWDGVNLDSPDHQSHMAYPSGIDSGSCPPSHPVHLVSIFYESWFNAGPFANQGGQFVLANGDPTGYGLHGDFMDGWNKDVLSRAIQTCTDGSGVIENCPVFANENRFVSDAEMNSCTAPNPMPSEDVQGPMQHLPGCVAVTKGPAPATAANLDPGCVSGSGNPAPSSSTPQNTSSSSIPASSSPVIPPPSTSSAAGEGSTSSSSSMPASSSPTSPPPNSTPAPGDSTVPSSSSSVPAYSSPTSPAQNTMPASSDDSGVPSSSSSMPAYSSPASPPQNTLPASSDDSGPGSSAPTQPPPANAGPSPSSNTPAPPSVASPNPTTTNTPAPANPPGGSNTYDGNGNGSPSPSSSPASGSPSSMNPGPVPPTTSTIQPSSTTSKESAPPSSSSSSSGNSHGHHGHKQHGHHSQQQDNDNDDSDDGYCTGRPKKRATKKRSGSTRRPMRRRHHARRDSYMYL